jgi:hypothetical protein
MLERGGRGGVSNCYGLVILVNYHPCASLFSYIDP